MRTDLTDPVRLAAGLVEAWSGVSTRDDQLPLIAADLTRLGGAEGLAGGVAKLVRGDPVAREAMIDRVSSPETYFFRHSFHFQILASLVCARRAEGRSCAVLSAGCSTGEEAWSAAMVLAAHAGVGPDAGRVVGWDLNADRVAQAAQGRYRAWSVRAGLHGYDRFFRREGDVVEIDPRLRRLVHFERRNLLDGETDREGPFDAIFFRNVAIYWEREAVARALANLARLLAPDGVLLAGPCDPLPDLPADWDSTIVDGARIYRPRAPAGASRPIAPRPPPLEPPRPAPAPASRPGPPEGPRPAQPASSSADTMTEVEELAARGAYAEALDLLRTGSAAATVASRAREAILLLHLGRAEEAQVVLRQCAYLEPDDPSHRRWLAVALQALGRDADAARERRNALELER